MRIKLVNFKCYEEKIIDIPDSGITLFSGWSGTGKSSILQSIVWCLYGKMRGVYNNMAKGKCSVTIYLNNLTIYRQSKPNLFKLIENNITYEDEVAQQIINQRYGDKSLWTSCSYIQQDGRATLLSGSNSDKMELLNKLAFFHDDPKECIDRIDKEIKIRQSEFLKIQAEYQAEYNLFSSDVSKNSSIFSYYLDENGKKNKRDEYNEKMEMYNNLLQKKDEQHKLSGEIKSLEVMINKYNSELEMVEKEINNYNKSNINYDDLIDEHERNMKRLEDKYNENIDKMNDNKNNLEENYKKNISMLEKNYEEKNKINKKYTELQQFKYTCEYEINKNKTIIDKIISEHERLKKIYEQNELKLDNYIKENNIIFDKNKEYNFTDNDVWSIRNDEKNRTEMIEKCKLLGINYIQSDINKLKNDINNSIKTLNNIMHECKIREKIKTLEDNCNINAKKIERVEIDEAKKHYQSLLSGKNLLTCPCCNESLRYISGKLEKSNVKSASQEEINGALTKIQNLEKEYIYYQNQNNIINEINSLKSLLSTPQPITSVEKINTELNNYNNILKILNEIKIIDEHNYSSTLVQLYIEYKKSKYNEDVNIDEYKKKIDENANKLENVKNEINEISLKLKNIPDMKYIENMNNDIKDKINSINNEITKEKQLYYNNKSEIQSKILQLNNEKKLNEENIYKYKMNKMKIEDIRKNINQTNNRLNILKNDIVTNIDIEIKNIYDILVGINNHINLAEQCDVLYKRQGILNEKYTNNTRKYNELINLNRFRQIAIDLECEQLQSTVDIINSIMNDILSIIFDSPITVTLKLYKKIKSNKRTKPTVNLVILYKGNEYDNINSLSGGEMDRVSMALVIAMNKVSNSPFLLFDESMRSIHQELRLSTIDAIKQYIPDNKIVIFIGHEDTKGNYDNTISFD